MSRFFIVPVGLLILMIVVLGVGLTLDPRQAPSPFIDKPTPAFSLTDLKHPYRTLNTHDILGKVWLVNVWASWCVSCRGEHPLLMELARSSKVSLFGLNYKDRREDALRWLDSIRRHRGGILNVASITGFVPGPGMAAPLSPGYGSIESVGVSLFTTYVLPFEITGLLMLTAVIGAVVLARKKIA